MSQTRTLLQLDDEWLQHRLHPNVLVLDYLQYSLDGDEWSEPMPVTRARQRIFEALGLAGIQGYQPWYLERQQMYPEPKPVWLRFFVDSMIAAVEASLLVENLDQWQVSVNGVAVSGGASDSAGTAEWLWDRDFRSTPIGHALREGRNTVELRSTLQKDLEIEDVFVIGDFAVDLQHPSQPAIHAEPSSLATGDWTRQGYPFYAGGMRYSQTIELPERPIGRAVLRLPQVAAACVSVQVNDGEPHWLGWQPWEVDISEQLTTGAIRISLDVYSSLRNAFGPLHRRDANELTWVGPEEFEEGEAWTDDYVLRPYGLLAGAELLLS